MVRNAVCKVMWVGKATVFLIGLAVILALLFGVASTALAHKGDKGFFHLAHKNVTSKVSTLVTQGTGPALSLRVESGPPLAVNSTDKVENLNSDQLDGKSESDFAPIEVEAWREVGTTGQPAFQSGWKNYGGEFPATAAFYKDPWGVVHLKGLVKDGVVGETGIIFELPCGYGPAQNEYHPTISNNALGRVSIFHEDDCPVAGQTKAYVLASTPNSNVWLSLSGITWRAAGS